VYVKAGLEKEKAALSDGRKILVGIESRSCCVPCATGAGRRPVW